MEVEMAERKVHFNDKIRILVLNYLMRLGETSRLDPNVIKIREERYYREGGFHVSYIIDDVLHYGPSFVRVKSNDYGDFKSVNFPSSQDSTIVIRFTNILIMINEKVGYESLFEAFTTKLKDLLRENDIEFEESAGGKRSKRRKSRRSRKSRKSRRIRKR